MSEAERKEIFYLRLITIILAILTVFIIGCSIYFMRQFLNEIAQINECMDSINNTVQSIDVQSLNEFFKTIGNVGSFFQ